MGQESKARNGTFSHLLMGEFRYDLQFCAIIVASLSLPYLFDGSILFFAILRNRLLQRYCSGTTRAEIPVFFPTLFLLDLSFKKSGSSDIVDMHSVLSREFRLEFRVADKVWETRHDDLMASAENLKLRPEWAYWEVKPTLR